MGQKFLQLLEKENIDIETGKPTKDGKLSVNFKDLLATAFLEILEQKSSLYRSMLEKGIKINLENAFEFPEQGFQGKLPELINDFKEDVK